MASSCAGHGVCWLHCLSLYFAELGNILIETGSVLCPGIDDLAVLGELFCGKDEGTWELAGTNNGYVLPPGIDSLAVLRELSCGEDEGIHLPLPTRD